MSYVKRGIIEELHKPARRNFLRRKTIVKNYEDLWQCDLADMQKYSKENDNNRYIVVVINCYSKYVWTVPVTDKTGASITEAMKHVLDKSANAPKNFQTDLGTEFYNKKFAALMKQYNINHYSTYTTKKAAMAERVIRTLKTSIYKQFQIRGNYRWLDTLQTITDKYNRTVHNTTRMRPIDVDINTKLNLSISKIQKRKLPKYKIGEVVRISKYKNQFEKGYTANYTTELFKILQVNSTHPVTYKIEDMNGNEIKGGFYEMELLKTKYPNDYLVERTLRTRGSKALVKWLGFPNEENSWINITDII